ncbi:hypothetical protein AYI68_g915 [Smittium mucronatum]|uniref:Uncharacterized protein n=1 Tax=Smittium mucronatum TaxID=133383 RepID=A0A1R0H6Z0_9FUNG|nr:hypothetical protein AYI68_g915 [Smittium mucronatum]
MGRNTRIAFVASAILLTYLVVYYIIRGRKAAVYEIPDSYLESDIDPLQEHFQKERQASLNKGFKLRSPTIDNSFLQYYDQVLFLVPFRRDDDEFFLRNLYSDLNIFTVCDNDNFDESCDIVSKKMYPKEESAGKIFHAYNALCDVKNPFKVYVKMDYDVIIDKNRLFPFLEEMLVDSNKVAYFEPDKEDIPNSSQHSLGKFYAFSHGLMERYCSCNLEPSLTRFEDAWFLDSMIKCLNSKNVEESSRINVVTIPQNVVYFRNFTTAGVSLVIES